MLYHVCHDNFRGQTLYPLNRLCDVAPDLYALQRAKYAGREELCDQRIPYLDCLWNDVLHLLPVHPSKVKSLFEGTPFTWREKDWFEIDPALMGFDDSNTAIFLHNDPDGHLPMSPSDFEPFRLDRLAELADVPDRTRECYRKTVSGEGKYLIFSGVPHILHREPIDTAGVKIVRV